MKLKYTRIKFEWMVFTNDKNTTQKQKNKTVHTNVSASKKTHFSYCVNRQQCNLVKVIPSSGRDSNAKLAASFESSTFTSCTKLKACCNFSRIDGVTPGVTRTAN